MEGYAFTKKQSSKGNLEMRTTFGRHMAIVLTKVNDLLYKLIQQQSKESGKMFPWMGWIHAAGRDEGCSDGTISTIWGQSLNYL